MLTHIILLTNLLYILLRVSLITLVSLTINDNNIFRYTLVDTPNFVSEKKNDFSILRDSHHWCSPSIFWDSHVYIYYWHLIFTINPETIKPIFAYFFVICYRAWNRIVSNTLRLIGAKHNWKETQTNLCRTAVKESSNWVQ